MDIGCPFWRLTEEKRQKGSIQPNPFSVQGLDLPVRVAPVEFLKGAKPTTSPTTATGENKGISQLSPPS